LKPLPNLIAVARLLDHKPEDHGSSERSQYRLGRTIVRLDRGIATTHHHKALPHILANVQPQS
jgi:hypothetical protein